MDNGEWKMKNAFVRGKLSLSIIHFPFSIYQALRSAASTTCPISTLVVTLPTPPGTG